MKNQHFLPPLLQAEPKQDIPKTDSRPFVSHAMMMIMMMRVVSVGYQTKCSTRQRPTYSGYLPRPLNFASVLIFVLALAPRCLPVAMVYICNTAVPFPLFATTVSLPIRIRE